MSNGNVAVTRAPLPHEHEHDVTKAVPLYHVVCNCGYDGYSDSKECPMDAILKEAFRREMQGGVELAVAGMPASALDNLINNAVAKALDDYKTSQGKSTKGDKS